MGSSSEETLNSRVRSLLTRSKRASELYARSAGGRSVQRGPSNRESLTPKSVVSATGLSSLQLEQWRDVNAELFERLQEALSSPEKGLKARIVRLGDEFSQRWREEESSLHRLQSQLITHAERSDFIAAALGAGELVRVKARLQATKAVYEELSSLTVKDAQVVSPSPGAELPNVEEQFDAPEPFVEVNRASRLRRIK